MPSTRDITDTIRRPELRELARSALAQGFRPGGVRKHGIWLMAPNGVDTVNIAHTSGDRRAVANVLHELRRMGYKDDTTENGTARSPNTSPHALKVVEVLVSRGVPMTGQELSAMVGEPWGQQFADMVRHLADAGQIERHSKITISNPRGGPSTRTNVYVCKGYQKPKPIPEPTPPPPVPEPTCDDVRDPQAVAPPPAPEPALVPDPVTMHEPFRGTKKMMLHRVIDYLAEVARPVHMYEVAEALGETNRPDSVGHALSALSRADARHPYRLDGYIKKSDKVQRSGHTKPIVRYEWVPLDQAEPTQPSYDEEPEPVEDVIRATEPTTTTLFGKPLYFWEYLLGGLAYGLRQTREREESTG